MEVEGQSWDLRYATSISILNLQKMLLQFMLYTLIRSLEICPPTPPFIPTSILTSRLGQNTVLGETGGQFPKNFNN